MTDFSISAVKYDTENKHIQWVKVHEVKITGPGLGRTVARAFVADLIRLKKATFQTIFKDSAGNWKNGAVVHVIDDTYLSTDKNSIKKDNLGELPEY